MEYQIIEVDGEDVEFPADMTDDEIVSAIKSNSKQPETAPETQSPFDPVYEFASSVNRGVLGMADVLPNAVNEALNLFGSDKRVPTFSGAASEIGVGQEFMQPGLARDVIQAAGETAPVAVTTGGLIRAIPKAASLMGGAGTAGQDLAAGLLAGAGSEVGEAVGESIGGETGGLIGNKIGGLAAPMLTAVPSVARAANIRKMAPTTSSLKSASDALYQQIDDLGVTVKPSALKPLAQKIAAEAKKAGMDSGVTPKSYALVQRILKDADDPLTVSEIETLRKLASGVSKSIEATEASVAGRVASTVDDFLDDVTVDSFTGSQKNAGALLKQARGLVQRRKKTELLQQAFENAKNQASGFENGLRTQFRSILKRINERKLKGWTKTEIAALEKVVRGGPVENMLKFLGKFGLSEGQATSMLGSSIGIGAGAYVGGPIGAVAVPLAGQASKYGAQAMTRNNAARAAATTALGPARIEGLLQRGITQRPISPALRAGLLNYIEEQGE